MNDFTASNGVRVDASNPNAVVILDGEGDNTLRGYEALDTNDMQALREFFQAEVDERLGRWRDPADPVFYVYSGGAWDGIVSPIRVVAETNGASWLLDREDHEPSVPTTVLAVARRYFDAHPEPKPWHDAKPGDVWEFTYVRPGRDELWQPVDREFVGLFVRADGGWRTIARKKSFLDESTVRSGRQVWTPEVAS